MPNDGNGWFQNATVQPEPKLERTALISLIEAIEVDNRKLSRLLYDRRTNAEILADKILGYVSHPEQERKPLIQHYLSVGLF